MRRLLAVALALQVTTGTTIATSAEPVRTTFLTSDKVRLSVLEAGPARTSGSTQASPGPVIAFVPGWSMPGEIFRPQVEALSEAHRVAVLDPRGQGESPIPKGGYSISRRAKDVAEFVARYPRVVLVGWSLGGLEALEAVHAHAPKSIAALVLVDNSVGEGSPPKRRAGSFGEDLIRDREGTLDRFIRAMYRTTRPEDEIERVKQAALRMPLQASLSIFPSKVPRSHWREIAQGYDKPLLYAITPQYAEQGRALKAARPETRVELFADAGHALFVDEPERFNRLLGDFVASIPR